MDIIRNASVLDQKDLLIFENHSLDKEYLLDYAIPCKNVTRLMLLVNLLYKHTSNPSGNHNPMMNNIIEKYVKKYPDEINKTDGHEWTVLEQCVKKNRVEAIKILLDNVANINCTKCIGCTLYNLILANGNLHIIQILLEYDGIPYMITNKTKKIIENISLLNAKN